MSGYFDFDQDGDVLQQLFNKIAALTNATTELAGLMSASDKAKLDGIESDAEENAIATIQIGGTALTPDNKVVNIETDSEPTFGSVKLVLSGPLYTKFLSYYTKAEVNQLVAAIHQFVPVVADSLPEASADTMYLLYLIPSTNPKTRNAKDEFITIRTGEEGSYTYFWEQIGTTTIDISGKEDKANKVTSFSNPTDTQYPSAKLVSDSLDKVKADVSSLLTKAGIAEGIADTISAGTAQEFLRRQSGGDGVNCIKRIKGKTIAWNQIIKNNNFATTSDWLANRGTLTVSDNVGTYTITTVASENYGNHLLQEVAIVASHKYFAAVEIKNPNHPVTVAGDIWTAAGIDRTIPASSNWTRKVAISSSTRTATVNFYAFIDDASKQVGDSFQMRNPLVIDLTILYSSGISGMTDAQILSKFQAEYPELYYGYNPGILKSNDAAALLTDGRNQWDEVAEKGSISEQTGEPINAGRCVRSKNFIPCFPNTKYFGTGSPAGLAIYWYNANKEYISAVSILTEQTSPSQAAFFKITTSAEYGTTYKNDICINLSDASFNGTYEPYRQRILALRLSELTGIPEGGTEADRVAIFPNGLGGNNTSYDAIVEGKSNKRRARVNLGDLTWEYNALGYFYAQIQSKRTAPDTETEAQGLICSKYACGGVKYESNFVDKNIYEAPNNNYIYIKDSAYTDAATFKAAMDGVYLDYQLATPIVYTDLQYADGSPFSLPATILVDNYGTERIQAPEGATTPSAPFCCDSNYSISIANLVKKLNSNE